MPLRVCGESVEQQINQSKLALNQGQNNHALEFAELALKEDPDNTDALSYKTYALLGLKRLNEAEATIDKMSGLIKDKKVVDLFKSNLLSYRVSTFISQKSFILDTKKVDETVAHLDEIKKLVDGIVNDNKDKTQTIQALMIRFRSEKARQ